jgi:DNA-binding NarL/FixJ family response regulator
MVPTSKDNLNPYPMNQVMKKVIQQYPSMYILVISMYSERTLIESIMEAGATGYLLKSDTTSMSELGSIILSIASGDVYFNKVIREQLLRRSKRHGDVSLTPRQLEAMSVCVAYSNLSNLQLAEKLGVAHSTFRNLLSGSYIRLGVSNRSAAIAKVREMGLIAPYVNEPHSIK